ncbi:hypothetical protein G7046_g9666 [Stylonectria norvegica]|nr:hypothetical protein G7046_g9666 [Stylonectria norvegica]
MAAPASEVVNLVFGGFLGSREAGLAEAWLTVVNAALLKHDEPADAAPWEVLAAPAVDVVSRPVAMECSSTVPGYMTGLEALDMAGPRDGGSAKVKQQEPEATEPSGNSWQGLEEGLGEDLEEELEGYVAAGLEVGDFARELKERLQKSREMAPAGSSETQLGGAEGLEELGEPAGHAVAGLEEHGHATKLEEQALRPLEPEEKEPEGGSEEEHSASDLDAPDIDPRAGCSAKEKEEKSSERGAMGPAGSLGAGPEEKLEDHIAAEGELPKSKAPLTLAASSLKLGTAVVEYWQTHPCDATGAAATTTQAAPVLAFEPEAAIRAGDGGAALDGREAAPASPAEAGSVAGVWGCGGA